MARLETKKESDIVEIGPGALFLKIVQKKKSNKTRYPPYQIDRRGRKYRKYKVQKKRVWVKTRRRGVSYPYHGLQSGYATGMVTR